MAKNDFSYIFSPTSGRLAQQYLLIPATTGVPAVGAVITSGAGAWGAYADIAAANAITSEFFIVGFYIDTLGARQIFELQVADATPTVLTEARLEPVSGYDGVGVVPGVPGLVPAGAFPIYMAANAQVQGRAGGAAAKTIGVSMLYTTG